MEAYDNLPPFEKLEKPSQQQMRNLTILEASAPSTRAKDRYLVQPAPQTKNIYNLLYLKKKKILKTARFGK